MKAALFALGFLAVGAIAVATERAPVLPEIKITPPTPFSKSLSEILPSAWNGGGDYLGRVAAVRVAPNRYVSRMPIVTPRDDIDPKMVVKWLDSTTDYKLLVKTPEVESQK